MHYLKSAFNILGRTVVFIGVTAGDALRIISSPRENLRQIHGVSFLRNAFYIITNTGMTLALGFIFWIIVARFYTVEEVGYGSALLSATALLSYLGTLGLGYGIIRYLPGSDDKIRLSNTSLTLAGLASVVAGLIFIGGLPVWSPELVFVRRDPVFLAAFVLFTAATTLNIVSSQVFIGFRRSGYALAQGIIWGGLKLVLEVGLAYFFRVFGIFASHGIAQVVALGLSLFIFLPRLLPRYRPALSFHRTTCSRLAGFSFANFLSEGLWSLPTWILPLMILNLLGAEANAYFYMAWSLSTLLLAIALGISLSLFAEGSYDAANISRNLVSSLKLIVLLLVPAAAVLALLGDKILLVYGNDYAEAGKRLLQILALASLPASINFLYLGLVRVEGRLKKLVIVAGIMAAGTLVLSYVLLSRLEIFGVGVGWLATNVGLAFYTVPGLARKIKHSGSFPDNPAFSLEK
jgi:O-antigen/teichoic acid export membrane protein